MAKKKAPRRKANKRDRKPRRVKSRSVAKQMSPAFKNFARRLGDVVDSEEQDGFAFGALWNELTHERYAEKELGQTPGAWWKAHVKGACEVRTAKRLGRVVRRWKKKEVLIQYGVACLDLLISLCRKARLPIPDDPGPFLVHFKDPDGNEHQKPFSECSEQEMEWAVRPPGHPAKAKKPPSAPPPPPQDPGSSGPTTVWQAVFIESLHDTLWKIGEGPRVGSGVSKEFEGKTCFFSIRKIDFHHIREVAQALIDAIDATLAPRPPWQDPLPMPPPDWLEPPPKA